MKKILFILTIISFVLAVHGQDTLPRTRNAVNRDNTYRVLQQKYVNIPAGATTATVTPNAYCTYVTCPHFSTDLTITFGSIANSYAGDIVEVVANGTVGTTLTFTGPGGSLNYGGTIAIPTGSTRCSITFIFDGTGWVETSRYPE